MTAVATRRTTVADPDGDAVEIGYRVAGDGPPIVLLHGIGLDHAGVAWREAIGALADEYRVYAPDLPGHGRSDPPRGACTTPYFRDVLASFLDEIDAREAVLIGLSMGGGVALSHAIRTPALRGLVLVDSYGLGEDTYWRGPASALMRAPGLAQCWAPLTRSKPVIRRIVASLTAGSGADPALVDDVHEAAAAPAALRTMRRWQRSEFGATGFRTAANGSLADLTVPTLLVHGAEDPIVPPRWSRDAHAALPDSELTVLAEAGHWVPREAPTRFHRTLSTFLAGL